MRNYKQNRKNITEILYGIHPVTEALIAKRRKIFTIYAAENKNNIRIEKILNIARSLNIPIKKTSAEKLKSLTKTENGQLIAAQTTGFPFSEVEEIYECGKKKFILLLDSILDVHNLGAIIRTALCAGAGGVIIPKNRSAMPSPGVSKTSAGALEHIKMAKVVNLTDTIKKLKKNNIWVAGLDAKGDRSLFETKFNKASAIVIGGEEKGLRRLVKKECDFMVSIPLCGQIDSLNASVSASVVMYEMYRQKASLSP
ncbi:MAG: 23S rRNA (guanosine(2251)-2'-O)-methyltransferase RlmB [Deltaproteobacteria bacterium]|nr:23S rRNA (guanosine(2251)-2'-O)-methyltransferase RlmB [Deltaproteobacteria bacterium]